jgi:light-regulated signal transduction histidine kinase (bacteriophytochrome)
LRAPLRHIDGFASILDQRFGAQLPPEAKRLLDVVTSETQKMGQLIDDLLRFSRLGRQPLSKQPFSMSNLFREVLAELQADQAGRKVEIVMGELPDCEGDRALLRQVAVNLLSNAFKFTRQRENARIETGSRLENQEKVYFVRDNGAGFDMQYAKRLYGVFQRLHSSEQFEGTGVGLSIVHRIVVRHGGRIWAEAAIDQGATFFFTLPG